MRRLNDLALFAGIILTLAGLVGCAGHTKVTPATQTAEPELLSRPIYDGSKASEPTEEGKAAAEKCLKLPQDEIHQCVIDSATQKPSQPHKNEQSRLGPIAPNAQDHLAFAFPDDDPEKWDLVDVRQICYDDPDEPCEMHILADHPTVDGGKPNRVRIAVTAKGYVAAGWMANVDCMCYEPVFD